MRGDCMSLTHNFISYENILDKWNENLRFRSNFRYLCPAVVPTPDRPIPIVFRLTMIFMFLYNIIKVSNVILNL